MTQWTDSYAVKCTKTFKINVGIKTFIKSDKNVYFYENVYTGWSKYRNKNVITKIEK